MEYALVLVVVASAIFGMQLYAKRSLQAVVKGSVDSFSPWHSSNVCPDPEGEVAQLAGIRYESGQRVTQYGTAPCGGGDVWNLGPGTTLHQRSKARSIVDGQRHVERQADGTTTQTIVGAETTTVTGELTSSDCLFAPGGLNDLSSCSAVVDNVL